MHYNTAITGSPNLKLPQWGRCFWQDPNDGVLFLAFASGTTEVDYVTSSDSGINWSAPSHLFPVDDFTVHNNFDIFMDPRGHVHCGFRWNGSGCYQFMGKSGSGWTKASGLGAIGFAIAGDAGSVGGFQGSLVVQEQAGTVADVATSFPAVKIAFKDSTNAVDSYWLCHPYNVGFTKDTIGGPNPGGEGGYPVTFNNAWRGTNGVAYYSDTAKAIISYSRGNPGWASNLNSPAYLSSGIIPFGPSMGFGSGILKNHGGWVVTTASTGLALWGGTYNLPTEEEDYNRLELFETNDHFAWKSFIDTSGVYGNASGTNCDISHNDSNQQIFYFQNRDEKGRQSIKRLLCDVSSVDLGGGSSETRLTFDPSPYAYPSGFLYVGEAGPNNAGGDGNILYWNRFKSVKHPLSPRQKNNNISKGEFLVTEGFFGPYPSGKILTVWNAQLSPGLQEIRQPYFRMDYTAHSGSTFRGVIAQTSVTNIANMFDRQMSLTNYGTILNGSMLKLELDQTRVIDEIHMIGSSFGTTLRDVGRVDIWASYDDITYANVGFIPSGNAITGYSRNKKVTTDAWANYDAANSHTTRINAFAAKYIRLNWTHTYGAADRRITEIRVWGPGSTAYNFISDPLDSFNATYDFQYISTLASRTYTERFVHREGTLPNSNWRTYGDFTWSIVASGDFTKTSSLPTAPQSIRYNGMVESGIWQLFGATQGNGDGFALRSEAIADTSGLYDPIGPVPATGIGPGCTGVVEVTITVPSGELINGISGRRIAFDLRTDPHPDDVIEVRHFSNFQASTGVLIYTTSAQHTWKNITYDIDIGTNRIQWLYRRGQQHEFTALGTAWIDNVAGLTSAPINSIYGFLSADTPYDTGVIYGYLEAKDSEKIHGYLNASPYGHMIHGYLLSAVQPDAAQSINGFLIGNGIWVNGYLLAGTGLSSIPTGSIYGYLNASSGDPTYATSNIYGYTEGAISTTGIPNYTSIHGYLLANYPSSFIYGLVNGSGENYVTQSIHGYLEGHDSGNSAIHGYMLAQYPISSIYGYLGNQASGNAVAGGPGGNGDSTSGVVPGTNWIWGYLKGVEGFQSIHGYLCQPPAVFPYIWGYVSAGADTSQIHGYLLGNELQGTGIHGWTSGIGWSSSNIHGYTFGISGIESSSIYGYLVGVIQPTSNILGTLIGSISGNSQTLCLSHGYPLDPQITGVVIPTVFFNN